MLKKVSWYSALVTLAGTFCLMGGAPVLAEPQVPPDMVWIPAGEFAMGLEGASNKTPHRVHIDGFFMDRHEVTQKKFVQVRGANPSRFIGNYLPVEQVTWYEARAYCLKVGKRLPTEAEWEKGARGGTTTTYFWGNDMDPAYTWFEGNAEDRTHPVASKKPNAYGLHDMSGNVWEWVADWYQKKYYEVSPVKNPPGPAEGTERGLRGGSWYSGKRHQTSATRYWSELNVRNSNFGFRCAQDAPE